MFTGFPCSHAIQLMLYSRKLWPKKAWLEHRVPMEVCRKNLSCATVPDYKCINKITEMHRHFWFNTKHKGLLWCTHLHTHIYTHLPVLKHKKAHTCTGFSLRPHRLLMEISFVSCYWLLLYPVAWLDHTRKHLTSSVFVLCSLAPSFTHPPTPSFYTSSPAPPTSFLCLPFISFHLSSLLTPPLASECDALMVRSLLNINPYLPTLHIFMLTNDLQCLPVLGQYSPYTLHRSVHRAPQPGKQESHELPVH